MSDSADLDVEAFRRDAHRAVDWMADYLRDVEQYPVLARVQPGELRNALPAAPPAEPESFDAILADIDKLIIPATTHWNAPGFLAYFGTTGSAPGIIAEMLTAALNVNAMVWRTGPAATELEQVAVDWLAQLLGLPQPMFGVINDTASSSTLYALAAAREALAIDVRDHGMAGRSDIPQLRVYASAEAHSSVDKAVIVLGLGAAGLRHIPVDSAFRMDPDLLDAAIEEDIAAGVRPCAVVATVGTTSTTSIDPVPAIAEVCAHHGLWLHVDAAYGGAAAAALEYRWVLDGAQRADSIVVNPHKWLFTPMDCSVLWCVRADVLRDAFSLVPEYLRTAEAADPAAVNLMDYGVSLGRRFRALKLWMVMRALGADGIAARIREHCRLASLLAQWVRESDVFELMAPAPLSVVCFRAHPRGTDDASELEVLNQHILQRVNAAGRFFLSHTRVGQHFVIRVAFGNLRTTEAHAHALWEELRAAV